METKVISLAAVLDKQFHLILHVAVSIFLYHVHMKKDLMQLLLQQKTFIQI